MAHEESADAGDEELAQSDRDEGGVAAAEVEPVAAQKAKPKAGIRWLFDQFFSSKGKIFLDLIPVAVS